MKTTSLILVVIAMLAVLTVHDVTGRPRGRPDGRGSRLRGPFGGQRPAGQGERPGRNEEGGDHHRVGRPGRQHHRPRACLVKNTTLDIVLCNSTCPQNFVCSEGKRSLEHLEIHVCKPQVHVCQEVNRTSGETLQETACPDGLHCVPVPPHGRRDHQPDVELSVCRPRQPQRSSSRSSSEEFDDSWEESWEEEEESDQLLVDSQEDEHDDEGCDLSGLLVAGRFPGDERPEGRFPGDERPEGRFPGDERPEGRFPGDERPNDRFPGDQRPNGRFTQGGRPEGRFRGDERPEGRFPGDERPNRRTQRRRQ